MHVTTAVRAFAVAVLMSPAFCDNVLSTVALKGGEFVTIQPLNSSQLSDVLGDVATIAGQAVADAIQSDVNSGLLSVGVTSDDIPNAHGAHDVNTIGLNPHSSSGPMGAVTVAHEYEHVLNARANGTMGDPTMKSSLSNPCGSANHAAATGASKAGLCALCGSGAISDSDKAKMAKIADGLTQAAQALLHEAAAYGCPPGSLPDINDIAPPCECLES